MISLVHYHINHRLWILTFTYCMHGGSILNILHIQPIIVHQLLPFEKAILRCTEEHPYHCLYIILALSNATKDQQFPKGYVTGSKNLASSSRLSRKSVSSSSIDEVHCYYLRQLPISSKVEEFGCLLY